MSTTLLTPATEFMLSADPGIYKEWAGTPEDARDRFVSQIVHEAKAEFRLDLDPADVREQLQLGAARLYVSGRRAGIIRRWKGADVQERGEVLTTIVQMAKLVEGFRLSPEAARTALNEAAGAL